MEIQRELLFIAPEGTFEAFEKAFMDSYETKECEPGVYRGESEGTGVNLVRIVRDEPDLGVFMCEQIGNSGIRVEYNFVLTRGNRVTAPLVLGCGPFPDDETIREMILPKPDQTKVKQLFRSAQQMIILSR